MSCTPLLLNLVSVFHILKLLVKLRNVLLQYMLPNKPKVWAEHVLAGDSVMWKYRLLDSAYAHLPDWLIFSPVPLEKNSDLVLKCSFWHPPPLPTIRLAKATGWNVFPPPNRKPLLHVKEVLPDKTEGLSFPVSKPIPPRWKKGDAVNCKLLTDGMFC